MLILDANIAAKFVLDEAGQAEVKQRLRSEPLLIAPDWIKIELAHVMWKRVAAGYFTAEIAKRNLGSIDAFFERFVSSADSIALAVELAFDLNHWVYDCLYLASALQLDAPLLTADRKFWNAAKRAGHGNTVELLSWTAHAG